MSAPFSERGDVEFKGGVRGGDKVRRVFLSLVMAGLLFTI
jgi:hypothetical protein